MDHAIRRWASFATLLAAATSSGACAKTGLAWVNEPESGVDLTAPSSGSNSMQRSGAITGGNRVSYADAPRSSGWRGRLDRTITLGEGTTSSVRADQLPATSPGAPVVVNVYVGGAPVATSSYGAFYNVGSAFNAPVLSGGRIGNMSSSSLRPGLDWPAVSNHGPAFPYRTGPASPWAGDGSHRR